MLKNNKKPVVKNISSNHKGCLSELKRFIFRQINLFANLKISQIKIIFAKKLYIPGGVHH